MRYLSVCSGIEAASVAWRPLGWQPVAFAEIDPFPSAVLAHRYPRVPNERDFTQIGGKYHGAVDLICGGTPCQSFSVSGKRKGMDDPRGNLAAEFVSLCYESGAPWFVWENVAGVLSSTGGQDLAGLLSAWTGRTVSVPEDGWGNGGIVEPGSGCYGVAWRVFDAQYVRVDGYERAVPQRRRRVFVVGYLGDWRRAAAVLFERESLSGHSPPSRKEGEGVARCVTSSTGGVSAKEPLNPLVSHTLRGEGFDASEDGTGRGTPIIAFHGTQDPDVSGSVTHPLGTNRGKEACIAIQKSLIGSSAKSGPGGRGWRTDVCFTLCDSKPHGVVTPQPAVRRLTPVECERLMGFPDNYTRIPWREKPAEECPDGHRYKALGNSWAVNCARWIGRRIEMVERVIGKDGDGIA